MHRYHSVEGIKQSYQVQIQTQANINGMEYIPGYINISRLSLVFVAVTILFSLFWTFKFLGGSFHFLRQNDTAH